MAVEYGLFLILLILIFIIYLIIRNYNKQNVAELAIFLMLLTQNITNDLIYAPDVAIYFWIVPFYFLANNLED
jgi:C4-dicarboxylate transporter